TTTSCITVTAVVKINCIAIHKAEKNVFTLSQTDTKNSTVADHDSFKTSQIAIPDSLIASHRSMKNSLIGSPYTYTSTAAATNAATTNAIGLASIVAFSKENATLKLIIIFFTVFIIATVVANDAIPATTAVINGIHGSNALYTDLNFSTISGIVSATFFNTSSNFLPNSATISRILGKLFF